MVIVKIIGGLGNQLFQYAFGKAFEKKTGIKVFHDIEDFDVKYKLREISLQHFNITLNVADRKEIERLKSLFNKILFKIHCASNGLFIKESNLRYYVEKDALFHESVFSLNHDLYLDGYWQSEKYFCEIKELVRSEFKIITPPGGLNLNTINKINNSNSVSLHVRRGDFITDPSAVKIYNNCSMQYYDAAIEYMAERVTDPLFFVFSDDIQWVKENMTNKYNLIFVDQNDADSSYEDLRLMSLCKHNIIANSTFSWWGAWLNSNKNKIVISPEQWFINNSRSSADLIPGNWITL